jgi:flagellar biosynthesis chaperone FliJ
MTINPRAVRALRDARSRMRDAAAAEHTIAQSDREAAAERLANEHDSLAATLDDASAQLASARTVHDLGQVAAIVVSHRDAITVASKTHADASTVADQTAGRLRDRARQLRTAERLVDMSDRMRADRDAKLDQRLTDDIGGRRR